MSALADYQSFLDAKAQAAERFGFRPRALPSQLFDFQAFLTDWLVRQGRGAAFADCGLGKTMIEAAWGEQVVIEMNGAVLILAPLLVVDQIIREAAKIGIEIRQARPGAISSGIWATNYEKLHLFDAGDFAGVICDESAILKSFDGVRRKQITDFMRRLRYRLLATATPSPNEYTELGTSSEALGYLGHMDMLTRFFKNEQGNSIKPFVARDRGKDYSRLDDNAKWRFKGHAEQPFWRWVCSWARACRKPSDLGFDDGAFQLPALIERSHLVHAETKPDGMLFALPAIGLIEQRDERRRTIRERCEAAAGLVHDTGQPAALWCHLNPEGDLLEQLVPDAVQVSGADPDEAKIEKMQAFITGQARVLVTKEQIAGWGLNFQHCAHSVSFPTHSFERYYQSIRRFWRFGQMREVLSEIVTTEGERDVLANLQRKSQQADRMFSNLIAHMNDALHLWRSSDFDMQEELPPWL